MKRILIALAIILVLGGAGLAVAAKHRHKTVTAPVAAKDLYVALGDSVAAGQGLPTASDPSACERTNESYPSAIASSLNLNLDSLACSGATLAVGVTGPQTVNELALPSQLVQLYQNAKPKLITITIGANDIDWTNLVGSCFTGDCGTPAQTAAVTAKLATLTTNLTALLASLAEHYSTAPPRVIVTGYYQVFAAGKQSCPDMSAISPSEADWWRAQTVSLNKTVSDVVSNYTFAKFAPVDFSGHEFCTNTPWIQDLSATAPFHPTIEGQSAIAQAVTGAYSPYAH